MSDTEINKGKLVLVSDSVDVLAEKYVTELPSWYDSKVEAFEEDPMEYGFVSLNGRYYKILEHKRTTDLYFADVTENEDGTVDFHTLHYNGGAHWTELVEDRLK